ncbi:class I SAM-dependent methyltransferase [Leucobacter sp. NPDC077196]|uniref:class I SAM-dependent methyltransferase n=1 Tax=Leucobacter sp. NPDC077196 TaxID=3154959 RepID=UPI0034456CDB
MVGSVSIRGAEFSERREATISRAFGNVLEIGAGRGANFDLLPAMVDWRGTEPDQRNIRRLEHRARRAGHFAPILNARAENLPVPDASVDTVLGTFVFCSVDDVAAVLHEVQRVLAPGGRLLLIDYVGAQPGTRARTVQRALTPWSVKFMRGCRLDRDIRDDLASSDFPLVSTNELQVRSWPLPDMPVLFFEGHKTTPS